MAAVGDVSFNVRERQKEALERMLRLSDDSGADEAPESSAPPTPDLWKVLVFDKTGSDIISLLLRIGDIRKCGITLTLNINSERHAIVDAPAVYFVSPSRENILRVCQDCAAGLYDSLYLNFTSSIPKQMLEELAATTLQSASVHKIQRVYDQYTNFLSLEPDLFVTGMEDSYVAFNDPGVSDSVAQCHVNTVAESLLSVVITMKILPIIRAPRNSAAELVAQALNEKLQKLIREEGMSAVSSSYHRPLLVIMERNEDLSVMLAHPWTYRALVHELLGMDLNRVRLTTRDGDSEKHHTYDLDCTQRFWSQHCGSPFPTVAVEVQNEVAAYKATVDEINKLAGTMGVDIERDMDQEDLADKGLTKYVGKLPELRERKKAIDTHTTIATALLEHIKARELDTYVFLEESLLTRTYVDPKDVVAALSKPKAGTAEDKLRLYLIYCLTTKTAPPPELAKAMEQALADEGANASGILAFIRKTRALSDAFASQQWSSQQAPGSRAAAAAAAGGGWGAIGGMFEKMYGLGVRALQPKSTNYYVTRVVDALMDLRGVQMGIEDSYIYLDPKISKGPAPRKTTPFNDGIVFVIGGGNYVEHQNLMDYCKRSQAAGTAVGAASLAPSKRIIYGTTELLHPTEFIKQLNKLSSPAH
eukprot:m51a1_g13848 putative sec1 family domain-containing protein 1 isoform 1 (646) ;mRNA; f:562971-565584